MSLPSPVRRASLLAAGALALASLAVTAPAANAAPVFTDADTALTASGGSFTNTFDDADCTVTSTGGTAPAVPVVENGPAASAASTVSASFADAGVPADTATASSQSSGTAKITSVAGSFGTLDFASSSTAQLTDADGSACDRSINSGVTFAFSFTVTTPGFITLKLDNEGGSYGSARIYQNVPSNQGAFVNIEGFGNKSDATSKAYLPAGTYGGFVGGTAGQSLAGSSTGKTTVHAEFSTVGSQTEAVSGKGKKYSTLPTARSCATDSIDALITKKKAKANQIKQVTFYVNDQKVKKVRKIKKNAVVKLPVADDVAADVLAEVQLKPAKKGRPAKTVEVSASYEACS